MTVAAEFVPERDSPRCGRGGVQTESASAERQKVPYKSLHWPLQTLEEVSSLRRIAYDRTHMPARVRASSPQYRTHHVLAWMARFLSDQRVLNSLTPFQPITRCFLSASSRSCALAPETVAMTSPPR